MNIIKRKNFYYLGHSFRKDGKVTHREKYLGKEVPKNIEEIKEEFLRKCMKEDLFKKLREIKDNFRKEWKRYPESIKKEMILDLAVDFTYNTNAIEGSTINHDETEDIIKRRISPNKPVRDVEETINHAKTFFKVLEERKDLSLSLLLAWHKEIFKQTKEDIAGRLRDYHVKVGMFYRAPDWQDLNKLMKDFFVWYNKNKKLMHPVELAARTHYKFEKVHPFGDGNGRIGRLIINYILKRNKYPLLIIQNKKRKSYYHALSRSENDFLNYLVKRFINTHKKYLNKR